MPRFAQIWFNGYYFGTGVPAYTSFKKSIQRIELGTLVRRSIGDQITFRVRIGNGHQGSILGKVYQDKYKYFVPTSINNPQGQPARNALTQAVYNWKNVLTTEQKEEYNKKAQRGLRMSGFNLYVGEYVKVNA